MFTYYFQYGDEMYCKQNICQFDFFISVYLILLDVLVYVEKRDNSWIHRS